MNDEPGRLVNPGSLTSVNCFLMLDVVSTPQFLTNEASKCFVNRKKICVFSMWEAIAVEEILPFESLIVSWR
jgi:hypothetical protein